MKQTSERPVTLSEVQEVLKEQEKEYAEAGKELIYEQKKSKEYADKFVKLTVKQAKEMCEQLAALPIQLPAERIVKIVDLMPETTDDVRAIFAKERFKYTEEEIKQITDLVAKYK
jgi:DNA-directed RNA polymerase subunit F